MVSLLTFRSRFTINAHDNIARAQSRVLRFRSALNGNDYGRAADFTHRDADADEARVLPVASLVRRIDARVCIVQRAEHSTQHTVKLCGRLCCGGERAKLRALGLPVNAVKCRIVITRADSLPRIIEDGETTI